MRGDQTMEAYSSKGRTYVLNADEAGGIVCDETFE